MSTQVAQSFPPPHDLGDFEKVLWSGLVPRLVCLGRFEPEDVPAASVFIRSAGYYLRLTRELQKQKSAHAGSGVFDTSDAEQEAAQWRRAAREGAADFGLLPPERAGLALVDADGEDIELKRILGLDVK